MPDRVRVAIGFTSTGRKGKSIGECWDNRRSADGHFEIFIRPDLAHAPDAMPAQIAAILAHELVHAAVGIPAGHGNLCRTRIVELVERMERCAFHVLDQRYFVDEDVAVGVADDAGHRRRLGQTLLLHEQFECAIAATAGRHFEHSGLRAIGVKDGTDMGSG